MPGACQKKRERKLRTAFRWVLTLLPQTHALLEDEECGMTAFGAGTIFELWEVERITGDPRNSVYIREEWDAYNITQKICDNYRATTRNVWKTPSWA